MKQWVVPAVIVLIMLLCWLMTRSASKKTLAAWARSQNAVLLELGDVHDFDGRGKTPLRDENIQEYFVKLRLRSGDIRQGHVVLIPKLFAKSQVQWREDFERA
ncbi:MAG: hypothetical protein Q8R59_09415 [Polaromonas sp.]|nr:hypothetical protein [Polaromonas sp.]